MVCTGWKRARRRRRDVMLADLVTGADGELFVLVNRLPGIDPTDPRTPGRVVITYPTPGWKFTYIPAVVALDLVAGDVAERLEQALWDVAHGRSRLLL